MKKHPLWITLGICLSGSLCGNAAEERATERLKQQKIEDLTRLELMETQLANARASLRETIESAQGTMTELARQRALLQKAQDTTGRIASETQQGGATADRINRRAKHPILYAFKDLFSSSKP